MKATVFLPSLVYCVLMASFAVTGAAAEAWPVVERDRYFLIEQPADASREPSISVEGLEKSGVTKDSALGKLLQAQKIEKWKVYEDEDVRFEYPDHPDISVKVEDQRLPLGTRFYGAPVGSVDRRSERYYSIGGEKATWCVLMLQNEPWLDNGLCLCGSVALRVYVPDQGCLRAYDLLENGLLKKMQVLGKGQRLQAFEWTHVPLSQESYLHLTGSIQLKKSAGLDAAAWLAEARRQNEDILGFITPGMSKDQIIELLGEPASKQGDSLIYQRTDPRNEWKLVRHIEVPEDGFKKLRGEWIRGEEIPPQRGSLRWAKKLLEAPWNELSETDRMLIKKTCLGNLANCAGDKWNDWVGVASHIWNRKWEDPRVVRLIVNRFLDKDVNVNLASIFLKDLNPPEAQDLIVRRIRFELDESAKPEWLKDKSFFFGPLGDFHNLMVCLKDPNKRLNFIREALKHPHPNIVGNGYSWLDRLPKEEARPWALNGLKNEDYYIRSNSADAFAEGAGTREDLPMIKAALVAEKEEAIRETLGKAVQKLETN